MSHSVEDILIADQMPAFLVQPSEPQGPAALFLHWFDEAPNANRTQFIAEARELAEHGVTSLLPQLAFPWSSPPTDLENDVSRLESEMQSLLAAHRALASAGGVDRDRIAMVGHDFGAMHGAALFGQADFAASVIVAATPRWADWFLRFWPISTDRWDYLRGLDAHDPINTVTRSEAPVLFQFGKDDFYIAPMTGLELFEATPEPKKILTYDVGHAMNSPEIRSDRREFLLDTLGVGSPTSQAG